MHYRLESAPVLRGRVRCVITTHQLRQALGGGVIRSCSFSSRLGAIAALACALALPQASAIAQDFSEFSRARDAELVRARADRGAARTRTRTVRGTRTVLARAVPERPAFVRPPRGRQTAPGESRRGRVTLPDLSAPLPEAPLLLVVSLDRQRMGIYSKGKLVETTTVSTGTASDPTPTGVFAIIEKSEKHFSNIYRGAPMPFMQRLTMSGVALHSGHVTGRVESHGCVRLPHEYARRLFKATQLGVRVVVSQDEPEPVDLTDVRLLEPARIAAATRLAAAAISDIATGSTSDSGTSPPAPAAVDKSIDPRNGRPKGPMALVRDEVLRAAPVSILVSRAEGRVYVRHMFEPVIEMPITLSEPRRPIGTHVYTLSGMQPDGSGQVWSAITVKLTPRRTAAIRVLSGRRARGAPTPATSGPPDEGAASTAAEAIERFALPPEVIAQVAPLLRPGTSLVVTDQPQSKRVRTGWTDIIVSP